MALNIGSAVAFLELDTSKFTSGFKDAKKQLDDFTKKGETVGNKLKGLSSSFSSVGKTLSTSVTLPLSGIATAASGAAMSLESSTNKINTYFGDMGEEAERNQRIIEEVFSSGIPDSMEETADTIIAVRQNLKDLSDEEMVNISKQATILEQQFGIDMNETLRGVNSLMENFGLTSEEAMDYVVTATQRGLDKTNELGDNLAEYGPLWEQAGFSAQEMFAILENGLDSGAYNLDKVNDFVKEFTISLSDGRIEENIGKFSQGTQDLFYEWQNGEATAKDVFYSIISDMEETMSTQEALTTASEVWSSLGEDNAMDIITALNDVNDAYQDVNGAAEEMVDIQQSGATGALNELKNNAQLLAAEVGERLTPNIEETADQIKDLTEKVKGLNPEIIDTGVEIGKIAAVIGPALLILSKLITAITGIGKAIGNIAKFTGIAKLFSGIGEVFALVSGGAGTLGEALTVVFPIIGKVAGAFTSIGSALSAAWGVITSVASAIVGVLGGPLTIVIGIIAALAAGFTILWNTCDGFREFWINLWEQAKDIVSDAVSDIGDFFSDIGESISDFAGSVVDFFSDIPGNIENIFDGIGETISGAFESVSEFASNVAEDIVDFFVSIPDNIMGMFSDIGGFFSDIFSSLGETVQSGIDTILGVFESAGQAIQTFMTDPFYYIGYAIGAFAGEVYLGVTTAVQNVFTFITETVPEFFNSVFEWFGQLRENILSKITEILNDISQWAIDMWNKAVEMATNFFNSVVEWFTQLPGKIEEFVSNAYQNVTKWASDMWNKAREVGTNFLNSIVEFFTQLPGRVQEFVTDTYNRVSTWASDMWNKAKEVGTNFLNSIVSFFTQLPGRVWGFVTDTYNRVVSWGSDMISKAKQVASDFLNNMVNGIRELPSRIWDVVSQIPDRIKGIGQSMYNAGRNILNRLWDGIKSIGDSILGWFRDFADSIGSFVSGIVQGFKDVVSGANNAKNAARSVDGSHANGLRYVPFDGYVAELHEGERVLTKQEAESYNRNEATGGGDTFVFYNTKPDPYEYARQMKRAKEELEDDM